jgi:hypothetical protein
VSYLNNGQEPGICDLSLRDPTSWRGCNRFRNSACELRGRLECLAKWHVPVTAGDQAVQHLALDARIESGVIFDVGVHVADVERAPRVGTEDVDGRDAVGVRPATADRSSRAVSAAVAFSLGMRRLVAMRSKATVARPQSAKTRDAGDQSLPVRAPSAVRQKVRQKIGQNRSRASERRLGL